MWLLTSPFFCRSLAFSQSHTKVSASFTNISGLAVALAFDLVYCFLSVFPLSLSLMLVSSHYEVCVLCISCILNSGKHYKQLHGTAMGSAYCYNAKHQGTNPSYLYLNEQHCTENWHIHVPKVSWTSYHTTCPGTRLTNTDLNKTLTVTPAPTQGDTPTLTLA